MKKCLAFYALFFASLALRAQDVTKQQLEIDAKCDVYFNNFLIKDDLVSGGKGIEPVVVDVSGYKMVTFEKTTGIVNFYADKDSCKDCTADGCAGLTNIDGSKCKEMTGIAHSKKKGFLVGVFISTSVFETEPAHAINFTDKDNYITWGPDLGQVFYIGDGHTDKGETQKILIPADADKLYLGFADAFVGIPGRYKDNTGKLNTTIVLHKAVQTDYKERPLKN
ncbi:MAG: hypothetical protein JST82_06495 [Bacteroidetes bacterium]|nr:hypothetical protein [Bacteroidota bacterium]